MSKKTSHSPFFTSRFKVCLVLGCLLLCLLFVLCRHKRIPTSQEAFPQGAWDSTAYNALTNLIDACKGGENYAVFDFDKTTIVHDISNALMIYQIEQLRFADAPAHAFLDGLSDVDAPLKGIGISSAQMGSVLQEEYNHLSARLESGETLDQVHQSDEYLDFRARFISYLDALSQTFPEEVWYAWMPGLMAGMTDQEARSLVSDAIDDQLGLDRLRVEKWISPDGKWGGPVEKGIYLPQESRDLYQALNQNGIDTYVCSASLELIVEVLACDSLRGLGLSPDRVFGLRFVPSERMAAVYDATYPQPMFTGKVDCIKALIAPSYKDKGPVLVGGDSNGDVAMLTSFPDTRCGLIIDVGRNPESPIGLLAAKARLEQNRGRYLLQPAFAKAKSDVEFEGI